MGSNLVGAGRYFAMGSCGFSPMRDVVNAGHFRTVNLIRYLAKLLQNRRGPGQGRLSRAGFLMLAILPCPSLGPLV